MFSGRSDQQPNLDTAKVDGVPELETTDCPLCGSAESAFVRTVHDLWYGLPGTFQIVQCRDCTHVYLSPRPTPASIDLYYPADYGPYHAETEQAPGEASAAFRVSDDTRKPWYLSQPARAIPGLRRLYYWLTESRAVWIPDRPSSGGRVLELGCGDGTFLDQLQQQGWEAVGIEPAADPAQRARQRGLDVRIGTLQPGIFPASDFDACFAWMVVEHLHDPRQALQEIRRVLKSKGWLVFSVPNYDSLERRIFGAYWECLDPPRHLQHFRPMILNRMLRDCGFTDIRVIYQRNILSLLQSLGLFARAKRPGWRIGPALLRFVEHPTMWPQIVLSPLAKLLAWCHLGSRLTVIARVADADHDLSR